MSGELIVGGDPAPHRHVLPPVPSLTRTYPEPDGTLKGHEVQLENAVARCSGCGQLFVSREDPDGWGRQVYWTRLRWWHFRAKAKLRVLEAARIGGVAE